MKLFGNDLKKRTLTTTTLEKKRIEIHLINEGGPFDFVHHWIGETNSMVAGIEPTLAAWEVSAVTTRPTSKSHMGCLIYFIYTRVSLDGKVTVIVRLF